MGREVRRNLQIWTSSTTFPALSPGSCSSHFGHSVAPSLHAGILSLWQERIGPPGRSCTSRTPHCGEPVGPLCLGAVVGGGGGAPLVWQDDWAWKSLPVAQTHGIQMWLLLGPCILPELLRTWPLVCPNTEPRVQRAAPTAGGFPLASLYGVMHKPEFPAFLNCLKWNNTAKSMELLGLNE